MSHWDPMPRNPAQPAEALTLQNREATPTQCVSLGAHPALRWDKTAIFAKGLHMSNAIIKQQGDSSLVADNIWEFRLGAGSFILGALAGTLVTAAVGRLATKNRVAKPPTPSGWPINFAHRGGAKVEHEVTIERIVEVFAIGPGALG